MADHKRIMDESFRNHEIANLLDLWEWCSRTLHAKWQRKRTERNRCLLGIAYDGLNRITQVIYGSSATASANDLTVQYSYDSVGNRQTQTTKLNGVVTQTLTYSYGADNRLNTVTDQNSNQVAAYFYDAAGNRIQKVTPTGNTYYSYDERNLLTAVLTYLGAQGTATAGGSLYNLNYMNNNPTQTKVPINASGVAGVVVSSIALANGQEDPSNPFSGNVYGVANAGAMAFDGLTTLGLG